MRVGKFTLSHALSIILFVWGLGVDNFFITPQLRLPVLASFIVIFAFIPKLFRSHSVRYRRHFVTLIFCLLFLFLYVPINDVLSGEGWYFALSSQVAPFICICLILIACREGNAVTISSLSRPLLDVAFIHYFFVVLQLLGSQASFGAVMSGLSLGIIGFDPISGLDTENGRVNGATSSLFVLTQVLSVHLALLIFTPKMFTKHLFLLSVVCVLASLVFAQNRSLILAIAPAFLMTVWSMKVAFSSTMVRFFGALLIGTLGVGILISSGVFAESLPYLNKTIDIGDLHRFTTNYYMTVGVADLSPFFGISRESAWGVYNAYAPSNLYVMNYEGMATPTHHNQLGYYFRYYGLLGVAAVLVLYFQALRTLLVTRGSPLAAAGLFILITDLIVSMAHNNKLATSPLIWVVLVIIFVKAADDLSFGERK